MNISMFKSENLAATLILFAVILVVVLLFPPGRALIGFVLQQAWKLLEWILGVLSGLAQAAAMEVWRAHLTILRNLMPRGAVLPTVAKKKTTRKE